MTSADGLDRQLDWAHRQLDEVAAENVRLTGRATQLQRELAVRRRGYGLLAGLSTTLGAHTDLKQAIATALPVVAEGLEVQRVVALERIGESYEPFAWTGYRPHEHGGLTAARVVLPDDVTDGLLVTRDTSHDGWVAAARAALGVPVFVAAPVRTPDLVILAGREAEVSGFFLRLVAADVDTLVTVGKIIAAAVENTQTAALAEMKRFLAPAVAEHLLEGRMDEGYERRDVTLMAADMVGFTRFSESLAPDDLAALLNGYLGEITTLCHAHGGTVCCLAGDGAMVMFGAPEAQAPVDHAWAAVQTAFALRARLSALHRGQEAVDVRIGIHSGSCAVGVFGSAAHRTYTAIGRSVNLAARLESAARTGTVLVSPETRVLVGDRVASSPSGPLRFKGFADPVHAHFLEPA